VSQPLWTPVGDHLAEMRKFYTTILKLVRSALLVDIEGSPCGFENKKDIPDF
jgi:hypothetical protein